MKTISSASYSRLVDFESCNFKAWLKHAEKIPDPKPSEAADRGTMIHQLGEDFVRGKIKELPAELSNFADEFESLRARDPATLDLEQEWAFDRDWKQTTWREGWFRIKADCVVRLEPHHAAVIDYKTGKKYGNEIKHGEQLQLYALATFLMYPQVELVTAELWYLDIDDTSTLVVSRRDALSRYLKMFDKRARIMTESTKFPPNPNIFSCKWCQYGEGEIGKDKNGQPIYGTGHCDKRATDQKANNDFWKRRNNRS